jgi:hypothetical protein
MSAATTAARERPILFSAPMVRALLAGTKTQTRRAVKITHRTPGLAACLQPADPSWVRPKAAAELCPYGRPGDRLWVRETWQAFERGYDVYRHIPSRRPDGSAVIYAADEGDTMEFWRPSIHMPRWASRITLELTSVRVERLQDCSRAEAIAEGVEWSKCPTHQTERSRQAQAAAQRIGMAAHYEAEVDYVGGYRLLWEQINGAGSWGANPWVWVMEFKRVH